MNDECQPSLVHYHARIEAILFACGDPLPLQKLAEVLNISVSACRQQLEEMSFFINKDPARGISLLILEECVQLATKIEFAEDIKRALLKKKNTPISSVTMEVLAIIAYNQPVSRGFIEQVRGVNSNYAVNTLLEKGLIEEAGRLDLPGKPISYRTTSLFLRSFGLSSLEQLPPVETEENLQGDNSKPQAFSDAEVLK